MQLDNTAAEDVLANAVATARDEIQRGLSATARQTLTEGIRVADRLLAVA